MQVKKIIKRLVLPIVLLGLGYGIYYCSVSFPLISGYGAKNMCSAVFTSQRTEQQVREQELSKFPISLGSFTVNYKDSSVTGSVFGFATCKAIYRRGLGATLVNEITEEDLRKQNFVLAHAPNVNQDTVDWPMGDRINDSFPSEVNKKLLQEAIQNIFKEKDTAKPIRTRAVVVLYDGKLIAEHYAPGFTKGTKLLGWSMTKSVTGALIGLLVKQGKLNIDKPAPVPEWNDVNDPRHAITIRNLLHQSSGLNFLEDYSKSSDGTDMLLKKADMGAYTALHPLKDKPGTAFCYTSGNTSILSRIVKHAVGEKKYHAFPYDSLFYKLGMYSVVWEPDGSGTFVGSSYMYATARDWARFGLLYFNKGVYNKQRILNEDWIQQTSTPAPMVMQGEYGLHFWLNAGAKNNTSDRTNPHAPRDLFYLDGYEGQRVYIIPSKKLVLVRLGLTQHRNFNDDAFLAAVINAVK